MQDYVNAFCQRLKYAMHKSNLKQVDLVRITGISKPQMSSYINGKYMPKQDGIYLLAKALEVSPTWLMGLKDGENGIDLSGLTKEDLIEVATYVEFLKNRRRGETK